MTETGDRRQVPATEAAVPPQTVVVEERTEISRAMAGAVVVLGLMIPGAFVTGWRLGRMMGRLTGH